MRAWIRVSAGLVAGVLLWSGAALGQQSKPGCDRVRTPEKVEGQVVKVEPEQERVAVRESDGTTHEFQASKEMLQDLKVGDRIHATLRECT